MKECCERIKELEDALRPFVEVCVGKWGTMRKPRETDFDVGFIIPMYIWKRAKQALEGRREV